MLDISTLQSLLTETSGLLEGLYLIMERPGRLLIIIEKILEINYILRLPVEIFNIRYLNKTIEDILFKERNGLSAMPCC